MQHRVERPGTQLVAMTPYLFDDAKAEDRFLGRVVQDMQADQAAVEVFVVMSAASQSNTQ